MSLIKKNQCIPANYVEGAVAHAMGSTFWYNKVVYVIMSEDPWRCLVTIVLNIVFGTPITSRSDQASDGLVCGTV